MKGRHPLLSTLLDGRLWKGSGPWVLLFLAALNVPVAVWQPSLRQARQANLLANPNWSSRGDTAPRFDWSVGENLGVFLPSIPDARTIPLVVVSGMSQMFAINDPAPGDETISEFLDDELGHHGARAFGLAGPNLDNEEALFLLLTVLSRPETRPKVFLYGVCFDKFRNVDLRPGYAKLLARDMAIQKLWREACDRVDHSYPLACRKMAQTMEAVVHADAQPPDDLEHRLRAAAERISPLIAAKSELNGALAMQAFLVRNRLLHIKATSKRPLIASRYQLNQEFLGLLVELSRMNHVTALLYVIPLNPVAENPYVPAEYEQFKRWLGEFAAKKRVALVNLENAVPSEHWGQRGGETDFKHFAEQGHRLTAAAILKAFGPAIRSVAKPGGADDLH